MTLAARFAVIALLLPAPLAAFQQDPIDFSAQIPFDTAITVGTFDNGLKYYIRSNTRPEERAELRLVVNAGSILENESQRGLAHLLEHMAFNGTEHFQKQELVNYLETIGMRFGPNVNAFTSFDETVYMLRVPTDSLELLDTGFQILEDWAHGMTLDSEEVDAERGVVIEEWRLGRGASARIRDLQFPVLFAGSRYADRMPIGSVEVLQTFAQQTLRDFYLKWYRPDLMAVIAVGDFDVATIERMIKDHFEGIPVPAEPLERPMYDVPAHEETMVSVVADPEATSSQVSVYYKQPLRHHSTFGAYRQSLVEQLFNTMLNQRFQELAQEASPPFIGAFAGQGTMVRTAENFSLTAIVQGGGIDTGLAAILTEGERIRRFGFTATELEREKTNTLRGMEQAFAERDKINSNSLAAEYRRNFLTGESVPGLGLEWELYQRFMPTITLAEVNGLARRWIVDRSRVILASSPESGDIPVPSEAELLDTFEAVARSELQPYEDSAGDAPLLAEIPTPGEIVSEDSIPDLGVTVWELSNGVRVLVKPTDFQADQVVFRSFSPGGTSLVADEDFIAAATAATVVMQGGLGEFNLVDLQKKLAGKAVQVAPSVGAYSEGINGAGSPADIETMFQLIYLYFTGAREDTTAFISYKNRMAGFLENRSASPMAAFVDTLQVTLAQGHPRARPFSTALFDEMNLETSLDFYRDRFADASDFTFVFAGNIDLGSFRPYVETYLGGLPSTGRTEAGVSIGIIPPSGVIEKQVLRGVEPVSQTRIVFTGTEADDSRENRYALSSMTQALQIRLRERLREDLGATYSVNVSGGVQRAPESGYSVSISFGSAPERAEELIGVVFQQIDSLEINGPTQEDIVKVQQLQRRNYETSLRQNGWWVSQLVSAERYGGDAHNIVHFEEMIDSLEADDISGAAQTYLREDNYVVVTLLPETVAQ